MKDNSIQRWTGQNIARDLAKSQGVKWSDVIGKRRFPRLMVIRRAIADTLRRNTNLSLLEIGYIMERDHTTVMNLLRPKVR